MSYTQLFVLKKKKNLKSKMEDHLKRKMRKHFKQVENDRNYRWSSNREEEESFEVKMRTLMRREFALEEQGDLLKILWSQAEGQDSEDLPKAVDDNFGRIFKAKKSITTLKHRAVRNGVSKCYVSDSDTGSLSSDSEPCFSLSNSCTPDDDAKFMARYFVRY